MPAPTPNSDADNSALTRLWRLASDAWDRSADLAAALRIGESTVRMRDTGARAVSWSDVRAALARTARHRPEGVPALVEGVAWELLGVRGRWVPEDVEPVGDVRDELDDVGIAVAKLTEARRSGAGAKVVAQLARQLVTEADEAARAAVGAVQ